MLRSLLLKAAPRGLKSPRYETIDIFVALPVVRSWVVRRQARLSVILMFVTTSRLLGIDFGERRIGIAVSDGVVAVPLIIVAHESRAADLERVAAIVTEQTAAAVVVGLPLLSSGDEGEQARRCRRFGDALARRVAVPVLYHDETLSSVAAEQSVRELAGARSFSRRKNAALDDLAAANILQSYIDEQERGA